MQFSDIKRDTKRRQNLAKKAVPYFFLGMRPQCTVARSFMHIFSVQRLHGFRQVVQARSFMHKRETEMHKQIQIRN
jgi:hypothetical protein